MNCPGFSYWPGGPGPSQFHLSAPFLPPWLPGGPLRLLRKAACSSFSWSLGPFDISLDPSPPRLENLLGTESDWSKECAQDAHGQAGLDSLKPLHHDLPCGTG